MKGKVWFRILVIVAIVVYSLLLVGLICAFQEQPYPPTLCEALMWLGTSAGVAMAAGAFVALLVEYWPAWPGLPPKWKRPIIFGFCLVLPLLALLARVAVCGAILTYDTVYLAASAGAWAFVGSQFAHIYKLPSG